jgi:hypothetical protein
MMLSETYLSLRNREIRAKVECNQLREILRITNLVSLGTFIESVRIMLRLWSLVRLADTGTSSSWITVSLFHRLRLKRRSRCSEGNECAETS